MNTLLKTLGFVTLFSTSAFASNAQSVYVQSGYWTGNNNLSSSPAPHCACDLDRNVQDCEPVFATTDAAGSICYDEFIPDDSQGWVHANIFQVR